MSTVPDGPVDYVESVSVVGAKVMKGTWPDGREGVLIGPADPFDPIDARLMTDNGEIPVEKIDGRDER